MYCGYVLFYSLFSNIRDTRNPVTRGAIFGAQITGALVTEDDIRVRQLLYRTSATASTSDETDSSVGQELSLEVSTALCRCFCV